MNHRMAWFTAAPVITMLTLAASLSGCTTLNAVKETGNQVAEGNILTALFMGTYGTVVAAAIDVVTVGGLLLPDDASSKDQQPTTTSTAQSTQSDLAEEAASERTRLERDIDIAKQGESMLVSARKDASGIRLQRQMLEQRLAQLNAQTGSGSDTAAMDPSGSGTSELSASDRSDLAAVSAAGCKTTLAHLSTKIPDYPVKEIRDARRSILAEDLNGTLARARAQGYTPAKAVAASFAAAKNADSQAENGKSCIRAYATNPNAEVRAIEQGQYDFTRPSFQGMSINESCAGSYAVLKMTAVALRESSLQLACLSRVQ